MGKSSKDKRDAYYRLAKEQNWRARSAFKLIQIDEQFDLFDHEHPENVTRVVDLCAAPGSWSQVLSRVLIKGESFGRRSWLEKKRRELAALDKAAAAGGGTKHEHLEDDPVHTDLELKPRKNVKIVSIDLQPMAPLEGITILKADITHPSTIPLLLRALDPEAYDSSSDSRTQPLRQPHPVDLVISDGAPDVTGLHDLDIYIQSQLLYAALNLALGVLRPGGKFVAKIFRGRDVDLIYAQLRTVFRKVSVAKPRSSRASSLEAFVVCEGFIPPASHDGAMGMNALRDPLFGGAAVQPPTFTSQADGNVAIEVPDEDAPQPVQSLEPSRNLVRDASTQQSSSRTDHITKMRRLHREEGDSQMTWTTSAPAFTGESRWIPPFIACGDLSAWDSDASYALPPDHVSLDPVQSPTAPPYRRALEMRKERGGAYGKTKLGAMGRT